MSVAVDGIESHLEGLEPVWEAGMGDAYAFYRPWTTPTVALAAAMVESAAMLQDLTSAWQASAQVDTDLAGWADDLITRGCHGKSRSDAHLRASRAPESQATVGKRAFASLWNPLARQYGLTTYQRDQL